MTRFEIKQLTNENKTKGNRKTYLTTTKKTRTDAQKTGAQKKKGGTLAKNQGPATTIGHKHQYVEVEQNDGPLFSDGDVRVFFLSNQWSLN